METAIGQPLGPGCLARFATEKGKQLEMAEWGVGRRGDNSSYITSMYEFFREAGAPRARRLPERQRPRALQRDQVPNRARATASCSSGENHTNDSLRRSRARAAASR